MIKILKAGERAAVFRLGRFHRVVGPGIVFLVPVVDRTCVIDLDDAIPDWRETSSDELDRMVEFLAKHYPEVPAGLSVSGIREAMRHSED